MSFLEQRSSGQYHLVCHAVWLQPRIIQCPRQESSLVFDLRGVACKSPTLRGRVFVQRPAEESNLVRQFRGLPCSSGTPAGLALSVSRPGIGPGPGPSESPVRSTTPSRRTNKGRRLDLHQHRAVYKTAAFLFGHVGKHEREESNPVRQGWSLPALPGAHSCIAPGH